MERDFWLKKFKQMQRESQDNMKRAIQAGMRVPGSLLNYAKLIANEEKRWLKRIENRENHIKSCQ